MRQIMRVLQFLVPLWPPWPGEFPAHEIGPQQPPRKPPEKSQAKSQAKKKHAGSSPPRYGPERVAGPALAPEELELWRCIRGEHGSDCGHHR